MGELVELNDYREHCVIEFECFCGQLFVVVALDNCRGMYCPDCQEYIEIE